LQAYIPAKIDVTIADTTRVILTSLNFKIILNRVIKYIPAVTRVDECTSDDTGVGAAIASGSQAEKGAWALFVKAPIITSIV